MSTNTHDPNNGRVQRTGRVHPHTILADMNVRSTLCLFAFLPFIATAQTTWSVNSGGSTIVPPAPYYTPQHLTIAMGDSVAWTNVSGTHSVNGSIFEFPANPVPFSSGDPDNGPWTFGFRFNVPGVYNYHCN